MSKQFKPMLAKGWIKEECTFPKLSSVKYDGIRVIFKDGQLLSRSLKPISNIQLKNKYALILEYSKTHNTIFDGEFYSHDLTFQEITSVVNTDDKEVPESLKFHCFDLIENEKFDESFESRLIKIKTLLVNFNGVVVVEQVLVNSLEDVNNSFEKALEQGFEGLILRDPVGKYKLGRSTVNEGLLLKMKPFETFDSKVIEVIERQENLNESQTNELGRSFKRNTKSDKKGTKIASCLVIEYEGHKMHVTLTGDEDFRREIWENRESYIGKMFEWKAMCVGMKDVPRHPNFIRWRVDKD